MKESSEYNPMEIFHGLILEVFHEERNKKNARELMILSGLDLNSIIVEAKKRAAAKSASQLIDNDVKKVLILGERIQRIGELEEENEKLKAENEILTKDLNCSERAFAFYSMRINELEKEKSRFREPELTMLCDIIANGRLDHVIRKYPEKKEQGG